MSEGWCTCRPRFGSGGFDKTGCPVHDRKERSGTTETGNRSLPEVDSLRRERDALAMKFENANGSRLYMTERVGLLEEALRAAVPYIKWVILACDSPADVAAAEKALGAARRALAGVETGPGKDEQGNAGSAGGAVAEKGPSA